MRRRYRFLIIFTLVLILSVSCKDVKPEQPGDISNGVEDEGGANGGVGEVEDNENPRAEEIMGEFLDLFEAKNDAADLGIYIRENIKDVEKDDAEKMIGLLLVSQTEIIDGFIEKLFAPEYLRALNEDMGGILDKNKLEDIQDENVRKDYKKLVDGFMTIIRYEETPVVETDWKELNKQLSSYVSEDLGEIMGLYQKIQNYEYNRKELDVQSIGEDIIRTEAIMKEEKSDFIYTKARELYELQIYALLVGPEGNHLDFFVNKSSREYKEILELRDSYPESDLGQLIEDLDKGNYKEGMEILELIRKRVEF